MNERMTPEAGAKALAAVKDRRWVNLLTHGTLEIEYYAPRVNDPQQPHTRNEIYVIIAGTATFFDGKARRPCVPGEAIFVNAGTPHRFEDISGDFATWGIFYGPQGGEKA